MKTKRKGHSRTSINWTKVHESKGVIRYKNLNVDVSLEITGLPIYGRTWSWFVVVVNKNSIKELEKGSKVEAVAFAKEYMRKHPNG